MDPLLTKNFISTREAAKETGYNSDYLARLCRSGKINGTQVGRTWLLNRESLAAFVVEQEAQKKQQAEDLAKQREHEYQEAQRVRAANVVAQPIASPIAPQEPKIAVIDEYAPEPVAEVVKSVPARPLRRRIPSPKDYYPQRFSVWSSFKNEAVAVAVALFAINIGLLGAATGVVDTSVRFGIKTVENASYVGGALASDAMQSIGHDLATLRVAHSALGEYLFASITGTIAGYENGVRGAGLAVAGVGSGSVADALYEAQLALGTTVIEGTHAILNGHATGAAVFAEGSQAVPAAILSTTYGIGSTVGAVASEAPHVAADTATAVARAGAHAAVAFSESVANVGIAVGADVGRDGAALARATEGARASLAAAFEYRATPGTVATANQAPGFMGAARQLALFTYDAINSLFDRSGRVIAALFGTTVAYAPDISYPLPTAVSSAIEVTRLVSQVTNNYYQEYHPITYVYSGGVTEEYVKRLVENLRDDVNDREDDDDDSGPGLADISGESIEDLADVAAMTKSWGDLLFWNGTEWSNLATSSLGISGSGLPSGPAGAVQFTDGGNFVGESAFSYDTAADRLTLTYASTTGLSTAYASSTNLFAGALTLFGGLFDTTGSSGTNGYVLLSTGTSTRWAATSTLGISGNIGAGTAGQIPYYEANGTTLTATSSLFLAPGGNVGIGTTSPYARLSVVGEVVAAYFTATTTATSTFPRLSMNSFAIGGDYFTDITGAGLTASGGTLAVDDVTPAMLQAADFGEFTCNGTTCSLDAESQSIEELSDVAAMTEAWGDLLYWNGSSWANIATSSLGITGGGGGISAIGPTGQTQTGSTITFASSTTGTDFTITGAGNTITFNLPTASAANRGLLSTSDWSLFNNKVSSSSLSATAPLSYSPSTGVFSITQATGAQDGYLSSTDWNTFNNKISSSSLSGGTGISYVPATGVITNTGVTSLAGTANQITASGATGAVTLSLPSQLFLQQASTTQLSSLGPVYIGTTSTTTIWGNATSTFAGGVNVTSGGLSIGNLSGLLKGTNGAVTVATPGTDYVAGGAGAATTTYTLSGPFVSSAVPVVFGASPITATYYGLATTSNISQGQVLYGTSASGVASVGTSTPSLSSAFSYSGTLGNFVGGSSGTLSLATNGVALTNLAQIAANTVLANPTGALGNVQAVATSTFFGTGTGGFVLAWNNGVPQWVATSSINNGVSSIQQSFGSAQTGAITLATSSDTNVLLNITNSGGTFTFTPAWTGTLGVSRGGTGAGSFTAGQLVYGAGTNALQSVATTTYAVSGPFSVTGTLGALVGGTNSTITYTGLATTTALSSSGVLYSTNGAAGVSSAATSTPTAVDLTISGTGATIGSLQILNPYAIATTAGIAQGQLPYYTQTSGRTTIGGVATSSVTLSGLNYSGTLGSLVGGTAGTLSVDTSGNWTGTVDGNNFADGAVEAGDLLYGSSAGVISEINPSTNGFVLALVGGVPTWVATTSIQNGVASVQQSFGSAQTGALTLATSSDTNVGLSITNSGSTFTFTPTWTGTLSVARGGTGQSSFAQGWLGINDSGAFISSTSPTVNYVVATSTTATSSLYHLTGSFIGGFGLSECADSVDKLTWNNGQFGCGVDAGAGGGITAIGPAGQAQTGPSITLATTSTAFNGLTASTTITASGNTITFTNTLAGLLGVGGGGTGLSSVADGALLFGSGSTNALTALATTSGAGRFLTQDFTTGRPAWVATSTVFGTGTGGFVLAWNNGVPQWVATSSINNGVSSIAQSFGSAQTGAITLATSSDTNVLLNITNSGGTFTLTPAWTGTLAVDRGGTGAASFTSGNLVYGAGTNALQSVATTTYAVSGPFNVTGTLGALVGGTNSTITYTGLATTTALSSSGVLYSTNGAAGVSSAATSTPTAVDLTISGTGATIGSLQILNPYAIATTAGITQGGLPYFTQVAGRTTLGNVATTTLTTSGVGISLSGTPVVLGATPLTISNTGVTSLAGTANQIAVSGATGAVTLSLPGLVVFPNAYQATYGTTTYASSTALSAVYASSTNLAAGNFTLGALNGPLDARNGVVGATTSIGAIYGGTGQTTYAVGDILYADSATSLARLPVAANGLVLKLQSGVPSWQPDITSGGGGGATAWSTTTDSLAIYPTDTSDVLIIGASATTTANSIFEVFGRSYFSNTVGIATTAPSALFRLAIQGNQLLSGNLSVAGITATGTVALPDGGRSPGDVFLSVGDDSYFTDVDSSNTLGIYGQQDSTTGAIQFGSAGGTLTGANGILSTNRFLATYASSTAQSSSYASSTNLFAGNFTLGTLNGPLHANNGVVSATTSVGAVYGGTGQTAVTTGDLLYGSGTNEWSRLGVGSGGQVLAVVNGVPAWVATSSIQNGVASFRQEFGSAQTGAIVVGTSTQSFNGLTLGNTLVNTGGTFTLTPSVTGTLNNSGLTNSTISGIALGGTLADLTATDSTLTFSGAYNGGTARTVGLNLGNANTWTALQQFGAGASTTQLSANGPVYIGTTSTTTLWGNATSTFNGGIALNSGGLTIGSISGVLKATNGAVTSAVAGQDYVAGGAGAATTTYTLSGPFVSSAVPVVFGASPITATYYGLATTSNISQGQVLYGTSASGVASVGTSTPSLSSAFSYSGTLGNFVGGSSGTLSLATNGVALTNLAQIAANTVLANPTGALGNVQAVATSTFFGTGTGGFVLAWNNGVPQWVATSSINNGVSSIQQSFGSAQTGAITLATSSDTNVLLNITNSGGTFTFTPAWTGTLGVSRGGTGAGSFTAGQLVYGAGTNALQSVATTTYAVSGPFSVTGTLGALVGGTNSTITYTGLATTTALSSSGVLYSTNGAAGVSSAATSTPTAVDLTISGTGATIGSLQILNPYAIATTAGITQGGLPYYTQVSGRTTLGNVATTTVSCAGTASCTSFVAIGASPITITGSGLSSYDAFTHPAAGQSATTSLMLFTGGASTTQLSANGPVYIGTTSTTTIWGNATSTFAGGINVTSGGLSIGSINGLLRGTSGAVTAATPGTDYVAGGTGATNQLTYFTGTGAIAGDADFTVDATAGRLTATYASSTAFSASYASTTNFGINGEVFTDLTGTGLQNVGGALTLNATGDWTGTIDGNNFADGQVETGDLLYGSATGVISEINPSTNGFVLAMVGGIPTWVATSSINNGVSSLAHSFGTPQTGAITLATSSDTNIGLTITNSSGTFTFTPTWTGTLTVGRGGTGLSSVADGQLLFGSPSGTTLTALATTSGAGRFLSQDYTTGRPAWVATSTVFGTGTGGHVLTWNNGVPQWVATTTFSSPLVFSNGNVTINNAAADGTTKGAAIFTAADFNDNGSGLISIDYTNGQAASASNKGFLTSTDWSTFNNKISSTSLSGASVISYNSGTGVITTQGGTFGTGDYVFPANLTATGGLASFGRASTTLLSTNGPLYVGTTSTTTIWGNATSTFNGGIALNSGGLTIGSISGVLKATNGAVTSAVAGQDYVAGGAGAATTTYTLSGPFVSSAVPVVFGASPITATYYGLATTSNISQGQVLYGTSASGVASVGTSTPSLSSAFSYSGTLGNFVGGSSGTLSLATNGVALTNLAQIAANTVLANPTGALGNVQAVATSTFFGTGTGGFVLAWNNGVPQWVATSSINNGVSSIQQSFGSAQTGAITLATSSDTNVLLNITNSGGTFTFTPAWTGTLGVSRGGTGAGSFTAGQLVYGAGTNALQSVATTTYAVSGPFSVTGTLGALVGGTNSTITYTGLATTTALSSSGVLYSTNGAAGVSSAATSTPTAVDLTISGTGATIGSLQILNPYAIATTAGITQGGLPYYTQVSGRTTLGNVATTTVSCAGTASCTSFVAIGASPITITGSGLSSYDAFTHPAAGQSATTSLMLFTGGASTTQLSANGPVYIGTTSTTTIWGNATSTFAGGINVTSGGLSIGSINGLLRGTSGAVTAATPGTDYVAGGTGATNQLTYFTGTGAIAGDADFTVDATAGRLTATYASSTAFSASYASSTNLFAFTASTSALTLSSVPASLLSTNATGGVQLTTVSSPLSFSGSTLSIQNAAADGTTKGAAIFTAADFNDNGSGLISIDYTNGQAASASNKGFLTSTDWSTFNNKISSTSLSGASVISYNSGTGVITTQGGTFGSGDYVFPANLTATGGLASFGRASTTLLSTNGPLYVGTTSTTTIWGNATSTFTGAVHATCFTIDGTSCISGAGGSGTVNTGVQGYFAYYPSNGTTVDDQTALFLSTAGDIGIGTNAPTDYGAGYNTLSLDGSTTGLVEIMSGGAVLGAMYAEGGDFVVRSMTTNNLELGTNATTQVTIDSSGNVAFTGGGTLTLNTGLNGPLQANAGVVSATTSIGVLYGGTGLTSAPSYGNILVGNSSGGYTLTATSSLGLATVNSHWATSTADALAIHTAGALRVAIGTTTPRWALTVASSTGPQLTLADGSATAAPYNFRSINGNFYLSTSSPTTFATTSIPALTVLTNANVGIGTSSPYARLSVSGETAASYFSAYNSSATSTFAGGLNVQSGAITHDFSAGLTSIDNLAIGAMSFDADSGIVSWVDMPVTSAASAGTVQSYSAQLDGSPVLTIFGVSNGAGGVASTSVGISSSTPWGMLSVEQTNSTTSPVFVVADQGTSSPHLLIDARGDVGVGTSSPYALLSVNAPAGRDAFAVGSSTGTYLRVTALGTTTARNFDIVGATATSSSNVGFNITSGCFAINNTCVGSGSSGLASYDAWTHPAAGQSATTSLMLFTGGASTTQLSMNGPLWVGTTSTTTIWGNATSTFAGGINITSGGLSIGSLTGILKGTSGAVAAAIAGTDYIAGGAGAATTTYTLSGPFTNSATPIVFGSSPITATYTGLATTTALSSSQLLYSTNGAAGVSGVSTTTVSCAGSASCTSFTAIGASPITITGSGLTSYDAWTHPLTNWSATTSILRMAGLYSTASSTIGDGTQAGGLIVGGGATTTGNAYFAGNVGIGTQIPGTQLHVYGGASGAVSPANALIVAEDDSNAAFSLLTPNSGAAHIYFGDNNDNDVGRISYTHTTNTMSFFTSATEQLTISSTGLTGVGTTSPYAVLSVNAPAGQDAFAVGSSTGTYLRVTALGTTTARNFDIVGATATSSSNVGFNITSGCFAINNTCVGGSGSGLSSYDAWTHASIFQSATTSMMGFGTTTPRWAVQIASSTAPQLALSDGSLTSNHWTFRNANGILSVATASPSTYATSTLAALTLNANGFLGLASTVPSSKLSVTGNGYFTGQLGVGRTPGIAFDVQEASANDIFRLRRDNANATMTIGHSTGEWYFDTRVSAGADQAVAFSLATGINNFWLDPRNSAGFATDTPRYGVTIATSTVPQLGLSSGAGADQWTLRSVNGNFYLASSSHTTFATSSFAALSIANTGFGTTTITGGLNIDGTATTTSDVGFNISSGCYAVNNVCVGSGGGSIDGSGDTNRVAYWSDSNTLTSDTDFLFDGTTLTLPSLVTFGSSRATTTIAHNTPYAWTLATSTTDRPLISVDTTIGNEQVTIGVAGGDVYIGDVGNGSDLIFEESSTISGQGTNTITLGVAGDIFTSPTATRMGLGTTTPRTQLTISSSTASQLTLTDASLTSAPYNFRAINNSLYISTSSPTTFATTTSSIFSLNGATGSTTITKLSVTGLATSSFAGGLRVETGGFGVNTLTSCDSVDTDLNGNFICGTDAGGAGGSPAGSGTELQYRNGGSFGAVAASAFDSARGTVGFGTTTPKWTLQLASSTAPQLALSDGRDGTSNHWTFRAFNGSLYVATASPTTFATTSSAIFELNAATGSTTVQKLSIVGGATTSSSGGFNITDGCYAINGNCVGYDQDLNEFTTGATGQTYTIPTNTAMVVVEAWGAGGGGGGGASGNANANRSGGGGGGGGAYATKTFLPSEIGGIGANVTVSAGVGGNGGTGAANNIGAGAAGGDGAVGGSSYFGTTTPFLVAYGGGGGGGNAQSGGGGGGGGGTGAVGNSSTNATGATGGGPSAGSARNNAAQGGGGATAGTNGVKGGSSHVGGGGGGGSTTAGANNGGRGGDSWMGGAGGGAGASVNGTNNTGGAGGNTATTSTTLINGGGGTAGGGAGAAGQNRIAWGFGGNGGSGGGSITTGTGGSGGTGGIPGGGGGGGGAAYSATTAIGGAGGTGGRGHVRVFAIRGTGADLAEIYSTKDAELGAGDVVAMDMSLIAGVKKTESPYDKSTMGVVATAPGLVIGYVPDEGVQAVPVALQGRVPIKVSTENGPIVKGDLLTASSDPGVAMKATKPGQVIGIALLDYDDEGVGMGMVFLRPGYHSGHMGDYLLATDPTASTTPQDVGRNVLSYLMVEKEQIGADAQLTEMVADRVIAGLEVVAPRVITDTLVASAIEAVDDKIHMRLTDDGLFVIERIDAAALSSTFAIASTSDPSTPTVAVSIDELGNAFFAGAIQVADLEIGSAEAPGGITFYDTATGEPYCTVVTNGVLTTTAGKCGVANPFVPDEPALPPEEEPIVVPPPDDGVTGTTTPPSTEPPPEDPGGGGGSESPPIEEPPPVEEVPTEEPPPEPPPEPEPPPAEPLVSDPPSPEG